MTNGNTTRMFLGPTGLNAAHQHVSTTLDLHHHDLEATLSLTIMGAPLEIDLSVWSSPAPRSLTARQHVLDHLDLLHDLSQTILDFTASYETAAVEYLAA